MIFRKEWEFTLDNEVQASLITGLLTEEGIPHRIIRHGDPTFGNLMEVGDHFAHIETSKEYEEKLRQLYKDFLDNSEIVEDGEDSAP